MKQGNNGTSLYLSPRAGRGRIVSAIRVMGLAFTQRGGNHFEHAGKVAEDVIVPESQDTVSLLGKPPVPFNIPPIRGVLAAIDLDYKAPLATDKIHGVAADRFLPNKFKALYLPRTKSVPQRQLCLRRVLPQAACRSGSYVRSPHSENAPHPARKTRRPLPARGERLAPRPAS